MTTIELKQISDDSASYVGLGKYNMSKFPGCFEWMQPAKGHDNRWITGLDEDATSVNSISDPILKDIRKKEILENRTKLEQLTGLDLKANSTYWENFFIKIYNKMVINFDNPMHRITYYVLLANNYAVKDIADIDSPEYASVKFYMSRTDEEDSARATKSKTIHKAISLLTSMENNKPRLLLISKYLFGNIVKETSSTDSLYNTLASYIEEDTKGDKIRKFLEVAEKTTEELNFKVKIDEAIRFNVLRHREGYYQRGNNTYGRTIEEVISSLSGPDRANELASIIEETNEKKLLG